MPSSPTCSDRRSTSGRRASASGGRRGGRRPPAGAPCSNRRREPRGAWASVCPVQQMGPRVAVLPRIGALRRDRERPWPQAATAYAGRVSDAPPPEVPLDFAREWVEFPDPADPGARRPGGPDLADVGLDLHLRPRVRRRRRGAAGRRLLQPRGVLHRRRRPDPRRGRRGRAVGRRLAARGRRARRVDGGGRRRRGADPAHPGGGRRLRLPQPAGASRRQRLRTAPDGACGPGCTRSPRSPTSAGSCRCAGRRSTSTAPTGRASW